MTPQEFREMRRQLNLSSRKMGEELGKHWRTIQRYGSGEITIPDSVADKVKQMIKEKITCLK